MAKPDTAARVTVENVNVPGETLEAKGIVVRDRTAKPLRWTRAGEGRRTRAA